MGFSMTPGSIAEKGRKRQYVLAGAVLFLGIGMLAVAADRFGSDVAAVNAPRDYPKNEVAQEIILTIDARATLSTIDKRVFGTNLEWFNQAGGLAHPDAAFRDRLVALAREQGTTVYRFPGGILADYYDWTDGIGPRKNRPQRKHPTDSGSSRHNFGSPEFFEFLKRTSAEGLITVNAGTGTPEQAAAWVAYANQPDHKQRANDGFPAPVNIKLWEVGNELYLPGNPHEQKISVTPKVYAERFVRFADAMRAVDPSITVVAIGVAKSHIGPDTEHPDWTEKLLARAADKIDMIAVHNAYFPMLYKVKQPRVDQVYPALWASPEAVDESLKSLDALISRYEGKRSIDVAITEWGALYSLPRADPYWVDHVKTLGSGVYIGRMLQVFMAHPRVKMTNYFKFADRSFMGWVDLNGYPKVPYWVFALYAKHTGDVRVKSDMSAPLFYSTPAIGVMKAQSNVPELTSITTRDTKSGKLYVNFVNRSMSHVYKVRLGIKNFEAASGGELLMVSGNEPTAHNGHDIPAEWPFRKEYDPYSTAAPRSIRIRSEAWRKGELVRIPPFSVMTLVIDGKVAQQ
jgi:alpha-N-arabinofuranosidase